MESLAMNLNLTAGWDNSCFVYVNVEKKRLPTRKAVFVHGRQVSCLIDVNAQMIDV